MPSTAKGVLLLNLGSPRSPAIADVREYLNEFLMDGRVIDLPWLARKILVSGFIVPRRAAQSAEAYRSIWKPEGSPLVAVSKNVRERVQALVDVPVALAMRYGAPSTRDGVLELLAQNVREIHAVPLYPHYAMSSFETAVEAVKKHLRALAPDVTLSVRPPFYNDPLYLRALVESARPSLAWEYDLVLFSYHGLPRRHLKKSDRSGAHCLVAEKCCDLPHDAHATCYRAQVEAATREFIRLSGINPAKTRVSFQSRLNKNWLEPFTDVLLENFPKQGIRKLLVLCPSFVTDCLETLEEIGIRGKRSFLDAGGEELRLAPCLNEHPAWIDALTAWCREFESDQRTKETLPNSFGA